MDHMKRLLGLALSFASLIVSCETGGGKTTGDAYPLEVSANGRYLVDQSGAPFLMIGDAPQALMVNASLSDAKLLLANRAAHGFNTVWIMLLANEYCGGRADAGTIDGLRPFTVPGDLSTPNEAYFAHCDEVIRSAAGHGLAVILNPIETGGFLGMMRANGIDKCREYGRFLGRRYEAFDNIIWMSGSDFQTWTHDSDDAVVKAVASGIKETDARHIHTLQLNYYVSSSLDNPNWADLVTLNAAYTRYPVYAEVLEGYNRNPAVPVFLIEASYELENGADHERLRRQAYWSFLAGSCGHVYGNGYVWPLKDGWKSHLDSIGVTQFGYCQALLRARPWQTLVPDQGHLLVTSGYGTFSSGGTPHFSISENDYATAAATPDGKLAIVYMPTSRTITVDLSRMAASVTARWYNPTNGHYAQIQGSPFPNTGPRLFSPPGTHADGAGDWVLVLEAK